MPRWAPDTALAEVGPLALFFPATLHVVIRGANRLFASRAVLDLRLLVLTMVSLQIVSIMASRVKVQPRSFAKVLAARDRCHRLDRFQIVGHFGIGAKFLWIVRGNEIADTLTQVRLSFINNLLLAAFIDLHFIETNALGHGISARFLLLRVKCSVTQLDFLALRLVLIAF